MPPKLSKQEQQDFRDSSAGDTLTVRLIDGDGDDCGEVSGQVMPDSPAQNARRLVGGDGKHYEMQLNSGVLLVGVDGRELKSESEEEGLMKTGQNEDGSNHYEAGKKESTTWGFDYFATSLDCRDEEISLG